MRAVKHIFRYIKRTLFCGLTFHRDCGLHLLAYSDADWVVDVAIFLCRNMISWTVKKQSILSCSSVESKYHAPAHVTVESALHMATNSIFHARTRHIDIELHYNSLDLIKNVQVQAIIGPENSMQTNFVIDLGNKSQVPVLSFSATSPSLTSLRSPYFFRATQNDCSQVGAITSFIQAFGWREVVPIYMVNEYVIDSMQGVLGVRPYVPKTNTLESFQVLWKRKFQQENLGLVDAELNIFGLLAYDAAIALAMAVEKSDNTNFGFDMANVSTNSTDLEAFGVTRNGLKLLQSLLGTRFSGLTGDYTFVDRQLQSLAFQIVNVNGDGVRRIGFWTPKK
ncbi:hypothetical protein Patl1_12653 [Pistacia atlantica]|uniref:Uncharacterized protein n=1 Tax=Pistacia atlantica TaxID=434234 RepID=A0ACC1AWF4_9ROSI|nr:hypothetical protein Patl1_12653 [Pistacia atlantica]